MRSFDPQQSHTTLISDGATKLIPGGDAFWSLAVSEIEKFGADWLVSEFECTVDWPNWEMHPNGDEFVYLLGGEIVTLLETSSGVVETSLRAPAAVVLPRGLWHTAHVISPARMLHITRGSGTQLRPAKS
jgi:uncharacterized cupin superfamily protein